MQPTTKQLDQTIDGMLLLEKAIRRERMWQFVTALSLLLLGVALMFGFYNSSYILLVVGIICIGIGARFTFLLSTYKSVEQTKLFQLLRREPDKIVWVYSVVTERLPFGFNVSKNGIMYFKLINKDEISVSIPSKHLKTISEALNHLLPHATFGYTQDREQWYIAAPELLLRYED